MCRNSHNCACSIASKHIIAYIHRNFFSCHRIDCITSAEHARHFFLNESLTLSFVFHFVDVVSHSLLLLGSGHHVHIFALRSKHHECHTKNSVGTSGEYNHLQIGVLYFEFHLSTFAAANPVALSFLD